MKYSTVVLDLDGTLTNSEKRVTDRTRQALFRYMEAGGTVVLASGRPTYGVWPIAKELQLDVYGGYILSFNGGNMIDCKTQNIIYQKKLREKLPAILARFAKEQGVAILTYEGEQIITETPADIYVQKEAFINRMPVKQVEDFGAYVDFPVTKCLIVGDGDHMVTVEQRLKELLGAECCIFRSEPYFLEVVPKGIDKAQSLDRLNTYLGKRADDTAAFGDGFNDCSMIDYAGLGVAMGNAQDVVKDVADEITETNDADGVAVVVERFLQEI